MNEVLNFFKDVISGGNVDSRPVGLTSFKHEIPQQPKNKKTVENKEVKISDLMRRVH